MLESLHLTNVGPAREMKIELAPRLNLITGDNGLGKSFLLDVVWWALTRKWPHDLNRRLVSGYPARPRDRQKPASIRLQLRAKAKRIAYETSYDADEEAWLGKPGRPWNPGLVLYALADGSFAVWDPVRNYRKTQDSIQVQDRLRGYVFTPREVWDGLIVDLHRRPTRVCNGLIADWARWLEQRGDAAARMEELLGLLAPDNEGMGVGPLVRLSVYDARDYPSMRMLHDDAVPVVQASLGVRRVVAQAYMLLWSWIEHVRAAESFGESPTSQIVLIIDELESHLHPNWQRTILGAILQAAKLLYKHASIQLIAATHSSAVLASAEPFFDAERDSWFELTQERGNAALRKRPFVRDREPLGTPGPPAAPKVERSKKHER